MRSLHDLVDHRPLLLITARALIFDTVECVLFHRRDDYQSSMPGGALEPGETLAAARREVWEETGPGIAPLTLVDTSSGSACLHEYPDGGRACMVGVVFAAAEVRGTLGAQGDEPRELRHSDVAKLPATLNRTSGYALARHRQRLAPP